MRYSHNQQRGLATLTITVVLLFLAAIMVLAANRVGIFDLRMSANEARHKEAFAIAEAGLDFASQRFSSEFRRIFNGTNSTTAATTLATILANSQVPSPTETDGSAPETDEPYFTATITPTGASYGSIPIYNVSATGVGADGTGTVTVQRQITMAFVFGGKIPDVPVIVGGAVGTSGNFNIVANPNSGGSGIPVSIWSNDDISASSSSATCHLQYYDGTNAQCSNPSGNVENITRGTNPATALTTYDSNYPDLLPNDANFPTDLFNFLFGVQRSDWATKMAEAASYGQMVSSCNDPINSLIAKGVNAGATFPLWWITGDCTLTGTLELGSASQPIILVIDDHQFTTSGNPKVNGVVYLFNNPDNVATPSASMGGTSEIAGSFISDVGGSAMQGSYSVKYDPNIIAGFTAGGSNYSFAYIPASWRDF
jgi:hypothetical protein